MDDDYKQRIEERFLLLSARNELAPFFEHVRKLPELSFEDKEFLVDQFRWADQKQNFPELWSIEAVVMGQHILEKAAHYAEYGMFIIRLHGILTDFPRIFSKIGNDASRVFKNNEDLETMRIVDSHILDQLDTLKKRFTEIELLAIEFLRNQQAHVFPTKYQIQRRNDGTLRRTLDEESVIARIDEVLIHLNPYDTDPSKYAVYLAERSIDCLVELRKSVEARGKLAFSVV